MHSHLGYVQLADDVLPMGHLPCRLDQEYPLALTPRVRLADECLVPLHSCVSLEVTVTDGDHGERKRNEKRNNIFYSCQWCPFFSLLFIIYILYLLILYLYMTPCRNKTVPRSIPNFPQPKMRDLLPAPS